MIEHVKILFLGGEKYDELHAGVGGVKKIFFDQKDPATLVVTTEEGIGRYRGFAFVVLGAYKAKGEDIEA